MPIDYSIIIPAYNEEELLPRTIHSLQSAMAELPALTGELIVVDNNSSDQTASLAADLGARVVFEPVNQISRARNRGAAEARGQYLVFVDADTRVPADLLRAALTTLAEDAVCGGGARVGSSDSKRPGAALGFFVWNMISSLMHYAAGSFVYCRREAWENVGGFSHDLYASEEITFSKALRRWGRERGLAFRILPQTVDTSMRKMVWFGPWRLIGMSLPLLLLPWRLKSRKHCALWYVRPSDTTTPAGPATDADPPEHLPTTRNKGGKP